MSGFNSLPPAAKPSSEPVAGDQPLTLTVHSLPALVEIDPRRKSKGRWIMLTILTACLAPVLLSYLMYYLVRPEARKNYGDLIEPTRALPYIAVQRLGGSQVPLPSLQGQWLIVSVAGGACDAACEQHVYLSRQLREITGREKERVERIWLVSDEAPVKPELAAQTHAPAAGAQALRVPRAELEQWLQPAPGQKLEDHLYVVDPYGNWMMRWPAHIDANKAKHDLQQLLRASNSWDQPGRVGVMLMPAPASKDPSTPAGPPQLAAPGTKP